MGCGMRAPGPSGSRWCSGAAYLPWELWGFLRRPNWFHATLIVINVIVVLYIAYVRVQVHHEHTHATPPLNVS